ncbi:MAG: hypothetical protein AB7L92_00045 [Alphaproteobacteria bacterium]
MVDAPQVSNAPDPISQMQHIGNDVGSNLSAGWAKSIDDYINGLIHEFGDKAAAFSAAVMAKTVEMGGRATDAVSKAASPMKDGISVSPSHLGKGDPQHGLGQGKELVVAKETGFEQLGGLSPSAGLPSKGQSIGGHSLG